MNNIEVITTTMGNEDFNIAEEMKVNTDLLIANQSDNYSYKEQKNSNGTRFQLITTPTTGVSLNRNIGIVCSHGDILILTDDDSIFVDDYEKIVQREFLEHPEAEAIKYYCESLNSNRQFSYKRPETFKKANVSNIMSAGITFFCIKRDVLMKKDIRFLESLGPGRERDHGEDGVFFKSLFDKHVKVYISPTLLGFIKQESSSWFRGYDENYYNTNGYIYSKIYGKLALFAIIRKAIRTRKNRTSDFSIQTLIKYMVEGMKEERKQR